MKWVKYVALMLAAAWLEVRAAAVIAPKPPAPEKPAAEPEPEEEVPS